MDEETFARRLVLVSLLISCTALGFAVADGVLSSIALAAAFCCAGMLLYALTARRRRE